MGGHQHAKNPRQVRQKHVYGPPQVCSFARGIGVNRVTTEATVKDKVVAIGEDFWNIRGSFKLAGLVDLGTQSSLVKLHSGNFVLLDAYTFEGEVLDEVMRLTSGGERVEAVINLHPFHTVHVEAVAKLFPTARQYGTSRHHKIVSEVTWEPELVETAAFQEIYDQDFLFSVPRGVELVPSNDKVHFASVLAYHKKSRTLHVDDTLTWLDVPLVGGLKFHPTLKWALEPRHGAADEFEAWLDELASLSEEIDHLCTAHTKPLPPQGDGKETIASQIKEAIDDAQDVLKKHRARHSKNA